MVLTGHRQLCVAKFAIPGHVHTVQWPFLDADALRTHNLIILEPRKYFSQVTGLSVPPDGIIARSCLHR